LQLYPNPTQGSTVHLSRAVSGALLDLTGRTVRTINATDHLETSGLAGGVYVLRTTDGATGKLVVR